MHTLCVMKPWTIQRTYTTNIMGKYVYKPEITWTEHKTCRLVMYCNGFKRIKNRCNNRLMFEI